MDTDRGTSAVNHSDQRIGRQMAGSAVALEAEDFVNALAAAEATADGITDPTSASTSTRNALMIAAEKLHKRAGDLRRKQETLVETIDDVGRTLSAINLALGEFEKDKPVLSTSTRR